MQAILIILAAVAILIIGYVTYGNWLVREWGVDPSRKTPAVTMEDGVDYVAAKPAVLMGHHFSSIAGAGPINGPIQASVFGWFSADCMISAHCSHPSGMGAKVWATSLKTPWVNVPDVCLPSFLCWC